jgi:hypothetical protein
MSMPSVSGRAASTPRSRTLTRSRKQSGLATSGVIAGPARCDHAATARRINASAVATAPIQIGDT